MANLWFLTEERPKTSVIEQIIQTYCHDFYDKIIYQKEIKIRPVIQYGKFMFTYIVENIKLDHIDNICIKTVSGSSSFVDYLVFKQDGAPAEQGGNNLIMAVEETKTSDKESRNTGVYQRGTKFVYLMSYYRNIKMYMLYNEELGDNGSSSPSQTNIFGTNMLLTLGISIIGKDTSKWFRPFKTIDDLITYKNSMRLPPSGNVPIRITKSINQIEISGRLSKPADAGNIGHDPNIGALTTISKCLRVLGWNKDITITQHGVSQSYVDKTKGKNKFLYICHLLDLKLEGIKIPTCTIAPINQYWHYEMESEKMTSILLHVLCLYYGLHGVYENHAGCERGYFYDKNGNQITIPKYDANGNKINIPDVILYDDTTNYIILVEAKKLSTIHVGIQQIKGYDLIENEYIKPYYPSAKILRCLSIFGGLKKDYLDKDVLIYMNKSGGIYINPNAPICIKKIFRAEGINIAEK